MNDHLDFPIGYEFWITNPADVYRVTRYATGAELSNSPRPELHGPDHYMVRIPTGHEQAMSHWFISNEGTPVTPQKSEPDK